MVKWFICAVAFLLAGAPAQAQRAEFAGAWGGGISFGGWYPVRIQFDITGEGRVYPDRATESQPLQNIRQTGREIHFEWNEEDGLATFDGGVEGDALTGTLRQGERTGMFSLARIAAVDQSGFDAHQGIYRLASGRLIWIGRASELRRQPSFVDTATGRIGTLYQAPSGDYFSGTAALAPLPVGPRFFFVRERGRTIAVRIRDASGTERIARRIDAYREDQVAFMNGNVSLSGTLIVPLRPGRHPAVVFLHGSGPSSRHYFSALPYLLAANGVASLVYDKRGVGGSTGNRHQSTFADLADDALAGLRLLQGRQEIDAAQIGIWGHSQGGWTGPLAATRSPDVRFVVMAAGAAVSVDQQIIDQKRRNMRTAGFSAEEIQAAVAYTNLYFAVRDGRAELSALEQAYETASRTRWRQHAWRPRTLPEVQNRSEVYDPEPTLRRLRTPVLALLAGRDENVHPDDNLARLRTFLSAAGNEDVTIRVFPEADHDFWIADGPRLARSRYAEGYFQTIIDWILARVDETPMEGGGEARRSRGRSVRTRAQN